MDKTKKKPNILKNEIVKFIISRVEVEFDLDYEEMIPRNRKRHLVVARQLVCFFCKKYTKRTLYDIGSIFNRDHATVLHSITIIDNLHETNVRFRNIIDNLDEQIGDFVDKDKVTKYRVFKELLNVHKKNQEYWINKYLEAE